MVLGGLWHGAAWTFVAWGALHGVYLCINHAWNNYGPAVAPRFARAADIAALSADIPGGRGRLGVLSRRQHDVGALGAVEDGRSRPRSCSAVAKWRNTVFIVVYAAIAWFAPNTQEIMGYDHANRTVGEALGAWPRRPAFLYATAAVLAFGILGIQQHSEFIYFRF